MRPSTPIALTVTLALAAILRAQDPQPAFRFPTPPLAGTFANLLRDDVELRITDGRIQATGHLGGCDVTIDAAPTERGFAGTAQLGTDANQTCSGTLVDETLTLRVADSEWRLRPEATLDATLTDLGPAEPDPERNWTVAIYLGGDNDLEGAAIVDLLEMQRGLPATGCEVVVLFDRHRDDDDDASTDWTDTRVLRVRPGDDGTFERIGEPVERDTSDPSTLASFVTGVFRRFPAKHHAVFVWDHGGGFTGICIDEDAPGRAEGRRMLSLADVRLGIATALQNSSLVKLDLIAFDACLMAQLDVALAMHDLADAMVASEATVPGSGYPYAAVLPKFADDVDGREVAKTIVDQYGSFSEVVFESGSTLGALDLRRAPGIARTLDQLARQALAASATQWRALARALFYAECYQPRNERTADHAFASIDLMDLSSRLRDIPGIDGATLDSLQLQIAAMVLARYSGAERTLSHGLSIYGPHRSGQFRTTYDQTPLGCGNAWPELLHQLHELADGDQSDLVVGEFRQLDALGKPTTAAMPFGGQRLLFEASGNSIVEVLARDWQYDATENRWLLLRVGIVTDPLWPARWAQAVAADTIDLMMPQFREGKNELFHELGGFTFAITDGALQCYGSLDLASPSTQAPITAIARCTQKATGKLLLVEVAFDHAEWHAVAFRPLLAGESETLPRDLVPQAGDTFEFWFSTVDAEGKEGGFFTPALTWGDAGLSLLAEADEPGRYRVEMTARTMQGRTTSAHHDYTITANPDLEAWTASWQGFDVSQLAGTWAQFKATGPQQYLDLQTTCEVSATQAPNLFTVLARGGPHGDDFETRPLWFFEWRGLPCLRIVTRIADGQKFGWYGPARVDRRDGKLVLAMKALNASGVVWEWRQQ